jgi:hypothetical protein
MSGKYHATDRDPSAHEETSSADVREASVDKPFRDRAENEVAIETVGDRKISDS